MGIYREHVEVQILIPVLELEVQRLKQQNEDIKKRTGRNDDESVWRINVLQRIQGNYQKRAKDFDKADKRRHEEVERLLAGFDSASEIYRVYMSDQLFMWCRRTCEEYRERKMEEHKSGELGSMDIITVIDETARILGILSVSRVLTREDYDMVVSWGE